MILGILAPLLLALPAPIASDFWELRRGYLSRSAVVVDAGRLGDDSLERVLATARARFDEVGQVLKLGSGEGQNPRLLLRAGGPFPASFEAPFERMGFVREGGQFTFFGRSFERPEDGFMATFEDPERPGLPVTVWYANSAEALEAYLSVLRPSFRPGFRAFRGGELELSGALSSSGGLRTADLIDRRKAWTQRFDSDRRIKLRGFTCRVPERFEVDRALAFLDVLGTARARALTWADASGAAAEMPVGAIGDTRVVVHGDVEEMLALIGNTEISVVNPVTGTVHVLLAEGLPDDGGAAVAESAVRRLLGAPSAPWLGPAVGVSAAASWWGRPLGSYGARLVAAGVVPDLGDLLEPTPSSFLSPHVRSPLLGLLFEHLAAQHGHAFVRDLWTGKVQLDTIGEEPAWREFLQGLQREEEPDGKAAPLAWRAGCLLVPGAVGYGSRAVRDSLRALTESGANTVTLRSFDYRDAPEPEIPGALHPPAVPAEESDLALASAASLAHVEGLQVGLEMHLLASSQGGKTAALSMPDVPRCEEFFADYRPFLIHEALLAELLGAAHFSVGSGLENTTTASRVVAQSSIKRAGWQDLIRTARALFDGQVIYTAGSLHEAEELLFLDDLDVLALELFPALTGGPDAIDRGPGQAPDEGRLASQLTGQLMRAGEFAGAHGIGLWLTGMGFASTREAWQRTDLPRGATSPPTQLLLYRALATAVKRLETKQPGRLVGLQLWNWSSYPAAGGLADRGYTPQGKPAAELLPGLFSAPR